MEEGKTKRKRRRNKKKKSKSLFAETAGFKKKNTKNSNYQVSCSAEVALSRSSPSENGFQCNDKKSIKRIRSRIKRKKKGAKAENCSSSNLRGKPNDFYNHIETKCVDQQCTDISQSGSSNRVKTSSKANINNKLKKSVTSGQNLVNKMTKSLPQKLSLKEKLRNKLESGRFRWINEKLYTTNSLSAYEMFKSEPELFHVYHQGFSSQVQKWPVNPADTMIDWIRQRSPQLIIADMGCGEAKISQSVPNKVFSFDLVAVNDFVIACDMAKVPLSDESVDVVIFCLSLMGTNLNEFLKEAHRILKFNGILKIAEVVSRFECLNSFEKTISCFGFQLLTKDTSNKMFVQFEFKKMFEKPVQMKRLPLSLKPCLYKKR